KLVLPDISLTHNTQQIELIGPIQGVKEAMEKYEQTSEILKQKLRITPRSPNVPNILCEKQRSKALEKETAAAADNLYNIMLSYCEQDKVICYQLADRLIEEGYLVWIDYDQTLKRPESKIDKADVVLIYFSKDYLESLKCKRELRSAQLIKKEIIIVTPANNLNSFNSENNWLNSMETAELYYDKFNTSISFDLDGNFDLKYGKLLIKLLQYTKPGIVGQTYSQTKANKTDIIEEIPQVTPSVTSQLTAVQRREQERIYRKKMEKIKNAEMESKKYKEDLAQDIKDIKDIIDDVQTAIRLDENIKLNEGCKEDMRLLIDDIRNQLDNAELSMDEETNDTLRDGRSELSQTYNKDITNNTPESRSHSLSDITRTSD
ncbi:unnamed protein product, partial [Didymodactylos carnosus]